MFFFRRNELGVAETALKVGRPVSIPEPDVEPTVAEEAFFERVKNYLSRKELASDKPAGSRRHTPYVELLKYLHLFAVGILSKEELVVLTRGLLLQGHAPKSGANAGGSATNSHLVAIAQELMAEFESVSYAK